MPDRERVWLDADPGMGVPGSDVDDGLAMLLLLGSPEVHLEAISICFGNVPLEQGLECCARVLEAAAHDVPVYAGAAGAHERGRPSPAAEAMVRCADAAPGTLTLLAIAPLTNVATALALDPEFTRKLRRLVVMGGAVTFPHYAEHGEFNFHQDGLAAATVLSAPGRRTLVTMDLCAQAMFREEHLAAACAPGGPVAALLADTVPAWLRLWKRSWNLPGFFPWDPVAVARLTHPAHFDRRACRVEVEPGGDRAGRLRELRPLAPGEPAEAAVDVPSKLDGEAFLALLVERLAAVAARAARAARPA